jgi:hypothetical protein
MKLNILLFIAISLNSISQNIQKLEENNGFRGIKLGSEISNYPSAIKEESKPNLFSMWINNTYYTFGNGFDYVLDISNDNNFDRLDNAKILGLYLGVFKGKIRAIKVVLEYHPYTLELLELAYGKPNGFWKQWSGKNIYCYYHAEPTLNDKRPNWSTIEFVDKLLDEQFTIEKEAKLKADKELEIKRAIKKF